MTSLLVSHRRILVQIMIGRAMLRVFWAMAFSLSIGASGVSAQVVGSVDTVQNMLQAYGLQVKRSKDSVGDTMLSSRLEGINFDVYFYGCGQNTPCDSVQFSTGFDLPNGLSANQINDWNRDRRYGKAYLDDNNDPYIEYDVNLAADGVGPKNFDASIEIWRSVITDFRNYIGW